MKATEFASFPKSVSMAGSDASPWPFYIGRWRWVTTTKKPFTTAGRLLENRNTSMAFGLSFLKILTRKLIFFYSWGSLINYIRSRTKERDLKIRKKLSDHRIDYYVDHARISKGNVIKLTPSKEGETSTSITADRIIVATGSASRIPRDIVGAKLYANTLEQLLSLSRHPGRTLIVGVRSYG